MTTTRIYIAGPMSGYPGFNYGAFERAEEDLSAAGFDAISPAVLAHRSPGDPDALAPGVTYEDCLAQAIDKLLTCEAVATLPGWGRSHGARLEVALAHRRNMEVAPLGDWLATGSHPGAAFGLPPTTVVDPMGPKPRLPGTHPMTAANVEAEAPTVMVDPRGSPGTLRASLMRLGNTLRYHQDRDEH